jgi:hypothetical protein
MWFFNSLEKSTEDAPHTNINSNRFTINPVGYLNSIIIDPALLLVLIRLLVQREANAVSMT